MPEIPQERTEKPIYVVDTSRKGNQDFMGRVLGSIIRYASEELWKNRKAMYVYGVGRAYPIRVVAELPKGSGFEELALASVMPGILGNTDVTVTLNTPDIERLGLDPARLEEIVAAEAQGVKNVA